MKTITSDKWDDELWGAVNDQADGCSKTKLYFLFGSDDHWVANETRDALIAARGHTDGSDDKNKPVMETDLEGVPHAFCISAVETSHCMIVKLINYRAQ